MKKIIFATLLLTIILSSCFYNKDIESTKTWSTNINSTWSWSNIKKKTDNILKIIWELEPENHILNKLKYDKEYLEELPQIQNFYKNKPTAFYFYKWLMNKDSSECYKINEWEKTQNTCKYIINNFSDINIDKFIEIMKEYINNESEIKEELTLYKNIYNKKCKQKYIIHYMICKKILNENFNWEKYYIKYKILEYSNNNLIKNNYKQILNFWDLDEDFSYTIEHLIKTHLNPKN